MGTETTPHERKKLLKSCRFCVLSSAFVDQGILFKQIFKSGDHDAGLKNKIFELLKITVRIDMHFIFFLNNCSTHSSK